MALTASTMLPLSTKAPDFQLPDVVSGKIISLATFAHKKALLVMFICKHCPFVKHVQVELARIGKDYADADAGIVAISPNDAAQYPDDAPDQSQGDRPITLCTRSLFAMTRARKPQKLIQQLVHQTFSCSMPTRVWSIGVSWMIADPAMASR